MSIAELIGGTSTSMKKKGASSKYEGYSKPQLLAEISKLTDRKRYGLVWEEEVVKEQFELASIGKLPVIYEDETKAITTAKDQPTHILIEGDNYHALSVLNYTHAKSVDVIYIDPPYNTGENDFKYNDKFVDKEDGFRHSKWLAFMNKRLRLAKNLLKDTGVILIHIDENEFDSLNLLLESEIFHEKNNLGTIIWNKKNPKGDAKGVSTMHEYVFCYAKNKEMFLKLENPVMRRKPNAVEIIKKAKQLFGKVGKKVIPEEIQAVIKPFNYPAKVLKDFEVKYTLDIVNKEFQTWISRQDFSGGEKAYRFIDDKGEVYRGVSMAWPNKDKAPDDYFKPLIHPVTKKKCPVPARGWRNPSSTMKKLLDKGLILFGEDESKQPERKYLLKDNMFENTPSIYNYASSDDTFFSDLGIHFPYAKPVEVAKYLLTSIHPNPKVIVDFFAGSGTALHAVLELEDKEMQCILVTNNEANICTDVCYPRLKKVIKGYTDKRGNVVTGNKGNLRYYKTDFVPAEATHKNKKMLTEKSIQMLCVKEGTFECVVNKKEYKIFKNESRFTGILLNELAIDQFKSHVLKFNMPSSLFIFSLEGDDDYSDEFAEVRQDVRVCAIPEAILKVYRRIYGITKPRHVL